MQSENRNARFLQKCRDTGCEKAVIASREVLKSKSYFLKLESDSAKSYLSMKATMNHF